MRSSEIEMLSTEKKIEIATTVQEHLTAVLDTKHVGEVLAPSYLGYITKARDNIISRVFKKKK